MKLQGNTPKISFSQARQSHQAGIETLTNDAGYITGYTANRTKLELKLHKSSMQQQETYSANRTKLELKLKNEIGSGAFDKRPPIAPSWN